MSEDEKREDQKVIRIMSWGAGLFAAMTAALIGLANAIA